MGGSLNIHTHSSQCSLMAISAPSTSLPSHPPLLPHRLSPHLFLKRDHTPSLDWRLDQILLKKAVSYYLHLLTLPLSPHSHLIHPPALHSHTTHTPKPRCTHTHITPLLVLTPAPYSLFLPILPHTHTHTYTPPLPHPPPPHSHTHTPPHPIPHTYTPPHLHPHSSTSPTHIPTLPRTHTHTPPHSHTHIPTCPAPTPTYLHCPAPTLLHTPTPTYLYCPAPTLTPTLSHTLTPVFPTPSHPHSSTLTQKEGVRVYIQLYKEVLLALDLGSEFVTQVLKHPNIVVSGGSPLSPIPDYIPPHFHTSSAIPLPISPHPPNFPSTRCRLALCPGGYTVENLSGNSHHCTCSSYGVWSKRSPYQTV